MWSILSPLLCPISHLSSARGSATNMGGLLSSESSSRSAEASAKKGGHSPSRPKYPSKQLSILVIGATSGDDCMTELRHLPQNARICCTGSNLAALRAVDPSLSFLDCNAVLNVSGSSSEILEIVAEMYGLVWIHSITAGVDHILSVELTDTLQYRGIILTNAKGIYSSSLAEYVMLACAFFSKQVPRLIKQKGDKQWDRFVVGELRGKVMGIVGYGDIGLACAKLAKAYGMRVIALRRRPEMSLYDPYVDRVVGATKEEVEYVMKESDFLVVALALTKETTNFIGERELSHAKKGQVLINIARGKVIHEEALAKYLRSGSTISAAALDVFSVEPLPASSDLWQLENVLISPHNADMTANFRHNSVKFFCENCSYFINNMDLKCVVDLKVGY